MTLSIPAMSGESLKWSALAALSLGVIILAKKVLNTANKSLVGVTYQYLTFINRMGSKESFNHEAVASSLLSSDCQKILNGKLFKKTREEFLADLVNIQEEQGSWIVTPLEIIDVSHQNLVVMRLLINMNKSDQFVAHVFLRFNSDQLISEIDEVFTKVDGSYHFDSKTSRL